MDCTYTVAIHASYTVQLAICLYCSYSCILKRVATVDYKSTCFTGATPDHDTSFLQTDTYNKLRICIYKAIITFKFVNNILAVTYSYIHPSTYNCSIK